MRNIFKIKNIKSDIIEASISSHIGDNFFDLYKKTILINKHINKEIGINAINSYKRALIFLKKQIRIFQEVQMWFYLEKKRKKHFMKKLMRYEKAFTVKESDKDYEKLLIKLSNAKESTDNFFDNVIVNDENQDIKNNRLELLKMFCITFDNFIDFSKLEGL